MKIDSGTGKIWLLLVIFCTAWEPVSIVKQEQLNSFRNVLRESSDQQARARIVDELGMEGSPRAIALLIESLTFPGFPFKEKSLSLLLNMNTPVVYQGLQLVMNQASKPVANDIPVLLRKLNGIPRLLERIEAWKNNPDRIRALAAVIDLLGFAGGEQVLRYVSSCLYHPNIAVKQAAVCSLKRIGSPACVNELFAPLKMSAGGELSMAILDLVAEFCSERHLYPLFCLAQDSPSLVRDRIFRIILEYPRETVLASLESNIDGHDRDLCRSALELFERGDMLEEARSLRKKFKLSGDASSALADAETRLGLEVEMVKNCVVVRMAGVLDVYTFPKLIRVIEKLTGRDQLNIIIVGEQLADVDIGALRKLNKLAGQISIFGGTLTVVSFHMVAATDKKKYCTAIREFPDIKSAVLSYSSQEKARAVGLTEELVPPGTWVELEVRSNTGIETRRTKVISFDGRWLHLEWFSQGTADVFKDDLNASVNLFVVDQNAVLRFETDVIEQIFFPDCTIVLRRPRVGEEVDRRKRARMACDIPVIFYQVSGPDKIRKNLSGTCKNISLGGMLLETAETIERRDGIIAVFHHTSDLEGKKVAGQVVKRLKISTQEGFHNEYGIQFQQLPDEVSTIIAKYLYETITAGG